MAMQVVCDGLWLCDECMIVAVNGDASGLDFSYPPKEAGERLEVIEAGLTRFGPGLVPDFDSETGDGCEEFKAGPCACCHSPLAGPFHRFAVLGEE